MSTDAAEWLELIANGTKYFHVTSDREYRAKLRSCTGEIRDLNRQRDLLLSACKRIIQGQSDGRLSHDLISNLQSAVSECMSRTGDDATCS